MSKVIIALDFDSKDAVLNFLEAFEEPLFVKVGMELYYQEGPAILEEIKARGHKIFLDLKCHDIPNTVKKTMRGLARMGVDITNCHAAGGYAMMKAALEGLEEGKVKERPLLIAVTQLTSTSEKSMQSEQLIKVSLDHSVRHYAQLAHQAGLDGVVCSPLESRMIHDHCGDNFQTITPGVRLASNDKGDQQRVTTPAQARILGSNYIVVGRPITQAEHPVEAYRQIVKEFEHESF